MRLVNPTGKGTANTTLDVLRAGVFTHRLTSAIRDGVHLLRLRDTTGTVVAETRRGNHTPYSWAEIHDWADRATA